VKINKDTDKITGSKQPDMRAALIDCFKNEADIMDCYRSRGRRRQPAILFTSH